MKTDKNTPSYRLTTLTFLLSMLFSMGVMAQAEFDETIRIEADIDPEGELEYITRSFDTQIKTWANDYVELQVSLQIKANKQEDIDETLRAVKEISFKGNASRRSVNTTFWESRNCNMNRNKIHLNTGETVVLKKFNVKHTLYIPKTIDLSIDAKYADFEIEDIAGEAEFKIYNGKLYCKSIGGKTILDMRYSKAYMETIPEAEIKLYDSDIEFSKCGNFNIESKYSKVEIEIAGDMQFESYDDKYIIGLLGVVEGTAKYTEFDFGPTTSLTIEFYDSDLNCTTTGNVKAKSKYSGIVVESAGEVVVDVSYDDLYKFSSVSSIAIRESKYTEYALAKVNGDISLSGYDDQLRVESMSGDFNHIDINNKYGDFMLNLPENIAYRLLVDMKYGTIDYPSANLERKTYIKENSQTFMDAATPGYDSKQGRLIEIKGYDNKVVIVQ